MKTRLKNNIVGTRLPPARVKARDGGTVPPGIGIKRRAKPQKIEDVARVTIIGDKFLFPINKPLNPPAKEQSHKGIRKKNKKPRLPIPFQLCTATTLVKRIIDPSERSIPPESITND